MNCKPGDLALIIRGFDCGMAVTCVKLADADKVGFGFQPHHFPMWEVDREIRWWSPKMGEHKIKLCPDNALRPINGTFKDIMDTYKEETV